MRCRNLAYKCFRIISPLSLYKAKANTAIKTTDIIKYETREKKEKKNGVLIAKYTIDKMTYGKEKKNIIVIAYLALLNKSEIKITYMEKAKAKKLSSNKKIDKKSFPILLLLPQKM